MKKPLLVAVLTLLIIVTTAEVFGTRTPPDALIRDEDPGGLTCD